MMKRLEEKVAIITGGANGIGLATAELFLAEGASVFLVDRDQAALQNALAGLGARSFGVLADVADLDSARMYVAEAIKRFGRVDIAIFNAGITGRLGPIDELSVDDFERVMDVNVRSVWLGLQAIIPAMKSAGGGSVVITSSTSGLRGVVNMAPYITSKHAVLGLMKAASLENAAHNIRVNAICPAPIETELMRQAAAGHQPDGSSGVTFSTARIPLKRFGRPVEVAQLIRFLASNEASFITGNIYPVDGGSMAGIAP